MSATSSSGAYSSPCWGRTVKRFWQQDEFALLGAGGCGGGCNYSEIKLSPGLDPFAVCHWALKERHIFLGFSWYLYGINRRFLTQV